jgi:hypothetical protein
MPEIIRWEEQVKNGVYERYLYGLPIFDTNGVHGVEDAMVTFLRALVSAYPCAAQIGLMALEGDDPRALFAPLKEGVDFFLTQVDSYALAESGCLPIRKAVASSPVYPHPSSIYPMTTHGY